MNLSLLILIPLLTAILILFCKGIKQVRTIALVGSIVQLSVTLFLLFAYWQERATGNDSHMLFEFNQTWFDPLHINYHIGVDGISIAMILLTSFVVLAGILVSWNTQKMSKEFFFLLIFLSLGAYGYFISLDLFTLFFLFGNCSDTKIFADWHLGQRQKRIQCHETRTDADGRIRFGIRWFIRFIF